MVCGMIDNIYSARAGDGSNGKEKQADYGRRHKEAVVRGPMDSASGSSTPTCTGGDDDSRNDVSHSSLLGLVKGPTSLVRTILERKSQL